LDLLARQFQDWSLLGERARKRSPWILVLTAAGSAALLAASGLVVISVAAASGSVSGRSVRSADATVADASSVVDGFDAMVSYNATVSAGVSSVSASDELNGTQGWAFSLGNGSASASLTGAQFTIDTSSSGIDLANTSEFNNPSYFYFTGDSNAPGGAPISCPAPSASSVTCPSPGATVPPSGANGSNITLNLAPGLPTSLTTGFDSSVSLGTTGSVVAGDAPATVSVALQDGSFQDAPNGNFINVRTGQDNVDPNSAPTITANGTSLPVCSPPDGWSSSTPCANPPTLLSYQYSPTTGDSATCDTWAMSVSGVPASDDGTAINYEFSFEENEHGTDGCPIGAPAVNIQAVPVPPGPTQTPCSDNGTTCSASFPVIGLGTVTASVDSGQGVTAFDYNQATLHDLNYSGANAPAPPAGSTSTVVGVSSSGTATTPPNAGVTASGSGDGVLTESQFGSDPVASPPFCGASTAQGTCSSGEYFDVETAAGSSFATVTISDCNLGGGDSLDWWNGSDWVPVEVDTTLTPPSGPSYSAGPPPCASAVLSTVSSPTVSQLGGTMFAVVRRPVVSVLTKKLTINPQGAATARIACAHAACRGVVSIIKRRVTSVRKHGTTVKVTHTVVLGKTSYSIAAGKRATETIDLSNAGRLALGQANRQHVTLNVTVTGGSTVSTTVAID
jgi:hypothetical protein